MGSQAQILPAQMTLAAIRTNRSRKWRKAIMQLCRKVAADDGFHINRVPMQSALICIRDFETINGVPFDPFNSYHAFLVSSGARHARLFWKLDQLKRRRKMPA